jgi:hypothetical protein
MQNIEGDMRVATAVVAHCGSDRSQQQITFSAVLGATADDRKWLLVPHEDKVYALIAGDTGAVWWRHCKDNGDLPRCDFEALYDNLSKTPDRRWSFTGVVADQLPNPV